MNAQRSNRCRFAALLAAWTSIAVLAVACSGRDDTDQAQNEAPPSPSAQPTDSPEDEIGLSSVERANLALLVEKKRREHPERVVTRIEPKDGENSIALPEDFPLDVPLYPNSSPIRYVSSEATGTLTMLVIDESPETAQRYYEGVLDSEGWTIDLNSGSSDLMMLSATKDARNLAVAITQSDGETTITLIESRE